MSILAGYVGKEGRLPQELIDDKIKSFACMSNDDLNSYEFQVCPTKLGHVITRFKRDYPIKYSPLVDHYGNTLAVIGFFRFPDPSESITTLFDRCIHASPKKIENCEGEFVAVFAESGTGKIHIINDRFASKPFYVLKTSAGFYFSSNLPFLFYLASVKTSIDITGLLQMFSYGHTIGEKTIFTDVQRVAPASHLVFGAGYLHQTRYWTLEHVPAENLSPQEHASAVFNSFKEGAEYRANLVDRGVIALSGGLDSRLVAYCLPDKNKYTAFTFIDSAKSADTAEVNTAKEVSRLLGLEHHIEFIPVARTSSISQDLIYLTGGLRSLTHIVKTMSYVDYIKNRGFKYMMGGGPGDVIAGSKIPKNLVCIRPENVKEGMGIFFKHYAAAHDLHNYLENVFRKDILKQFYSATVDSFYNSFREIKSKTAAHKVTAWSLLNRWPAFTFTTPLHDHPDIAESFCHLDYRFCELMLRLPAEWLYAKNFYNYMICQNLVELRDVINANNGKKLSGEIINYQWSPPSGFISYKKILKEKIKRFRAVSQVLELINKPDINLSSFQNSKSSRSVFLYTIFKEDKKLFLDLEDLLHSIPDLKYILDIDKSYSFLKCFKNQSPVTGSLDRDTDLLGKLAAFCYSYKYLIQ